MSDFKRDERGRILPGHAGGHGRAVGSRNKLQGDFIRALAEDFAEHGAGVIRIARIERPVEYLKVISSVLPKEYHHAQLEDMATDELEATLETIRTLKAGPSGNSKSGGGATGGANAKGNPPKVYN